MVVEKIFVHTKDGERPQHVCDAGVGVKKIRLFSVGHMGMDPTCMFYA